MTTRQVYDYLLIELNKVEVPTLLLEDFVYFLNKAIINRVDKGYSLYELTQQLTDDLGVLSFTTTLTDLVAKLNNPLQGATYTGSLPTDYFHILGAIAEFTAVATEGCNAGKITHKGIKKLTSEMYSGIIDNYYLKPSTKNPYYLLHNTSTSTDLIPLKGIQRQAGDRVGFPTPVKLEVRCGTDKSKIVLSKVYVDYLRVPQYIILTLDQLESEEDTSQQMEFPDYMCYEIIKELVALLMENFSDPRLQTNIPVNQSIGPPLMGGSKSR